MFGQCPRALTRTIIDKTSPRLSSRAIKRRHIVDLLVIGGFEAARRSVLAVGPMVEAAVGERSTQPFME
jgi:hypothetical protein